MHVNKKKSIYIYIYIYIYIQAKKNGKMIKKKEEEM